MHILLRPSAKKSGKIAKYFLTVSSSQGTCSFSKFCYPRIFLLINLGTLQSCFKFSQNIPRILFKISYFLEKLQINGH